MKKNVWLFSVLAALTAAAALAQDAGPAGTAATPQKKKSTTIKKRVEMDPPATALVKAASVNVRGQPLFAGEVLGHLQNGATITVLEEITLNHPPADEPPKWYKIVMPTNIPAWLKSDYIDDATKLVKARRVNLRGGPGENYSVVGRLEKGAAVNELRDEKGWVAIEAPTNAYAFVAAELVEIQAAAAPVAQAAPEVAPVAVAPVAPPPATNEPPPAAPVAPPPTAQPETVQELTALRQAVAEPPGPRIVTREGYVHKAYNIQSPTDYELHDIKSGTLIEFLQPQAQQNFKIYVGTRVTVTGPEVIDQRWPRIPVLQVQSVDLMP
jgi:uncharacterized protein YraI